MLTFIKRTWPVLLYLALYFIAINLVVLNRFWQFEAFYFDHGIFDSSLWQVAHFQTPIIDHLEDGFISQFGDHFTPTIYLLSPVYWLTNAYEPILILQNLLVTASALVLFLIAKIKIHDTFMGMSLIIAYTLYIGLQNTIIANFHSEIPAVLTLSLTLYAIVTKKWRLYWLFLILTLGCKQNFAAIGLGLGIYLTFSESKKIGLSTMFLSLIYYFLATKFFIPIIGGRPYTYEFAIAPSLNWFIYFVSPPIKLETIFTSLATFGFLPVLNLAFLPTIAQDFFTRFVINPGSARWDLGLHYNATLATLLTFGAILGAQKLPKKFLKIAAILIVAIVLYIHRFLYHGALGLAYNPDFYKHTRNMEFLKNLTIAIPPGKSVMTLNNIAPHLTHTNFVMLLRGNYKDFSPDIIALDSRSGQNNANYWPVQFQTILELRNKVSTDSAYKVVYNFGDQIVYSK